MCVGFKRLNIPKHIVFPDGRLLIQGRNESGKSTVMEAVHYALYGIPLRPHRRASNDDIINYTLPRAVVELRFSIDDNQYTVRRTLRRRGGNVHELVIERPDETKERVNGARKVNSTIGEELHGIDSDSLLNSCLVEQKELGKLESASRMDRIRAMTTLLNLEAFVDAQQALNKNRKELESTNQETTIRLEKAEQAKKLYEGAEQRRKQAQKRMEIIEERLVELAERIDELDKVLKAIDEIKQINNDIEERRARLEGQQGELKRVTDSLIEAMEAEELAKKIQEELPSARSRLEEANRKVDALEEILKIQNELDNAYREAKRGRERLDDATGNVEETKAARKRVEDLNVQIEKWEPARMAQELLQEIEKLAQSLTSASLEVERLAKILGELKSKLETLKDAEIQINKLEQREQILQASKESISKRRTLGIGTAVLGLVASVTAIISPYILTVGLLLILVGLLLVSRNSPKTIDLHLPQIRKEREDLLGERARIEDYRNQMEENRKALEGQKSKAAESGEALHKALSQLPAEPREYAKIYGAEEELQLDALSTLRNTIQDDLQSLTRLETEREERGKTAAELEKRQQTMQEATAKHKEVLVNIEFIKKTKNDLEEKEEVSIDQEQELRSAKDKQQRTVQELEINLMNSRKKASEKVKLESDQKTIKKSIGTLQSEIEEKTKEKTRLQEAMGIEPDEEEKLRKESDELKQENASLETEMKERKSDIEESEKTMDEKKELRNEYPKLVEQDKEEKFELESMRRAAILLEITRDGIMAGVKSQIETHMMRFLPALTDDRYNMARIDEKNYRIEVFDREARRWRGKGVFSGATQDQFSLALRLAFALSTIPSSRGARPGFIFLDEPLSGFDSQRREGLLRLLREELPRYFDQIIVISHLEQLREEFPEQLQLEAGEVVAQ